jgi:hypothetical protein
MGDHPPIRRPAASPATNAAARGRHCNLQESLRSSDGDNRPDRRPPLAHLVIYVTSPDPVTPEDQMRMLRLAVVGSLLSAPAIAAAETNSSSMEATYAAPVQGWMVAERPGGVQTVRQVLPADRGTDVIAAAGDPLIIYVNKNGVTLSPGDNDSRTNRSTLVDQTTAIPAYTIGATQWNQIMTCFRGMYEPFNVTVTDVDPGNVPHMESIVTTLSSTIGMDPNVGGVSPYTIGCTAIPNSIVFTFGQAFNNDPETICEVMAQETAHSIGLDHEMLASDPLTYLQYNGLQSFKDQTVSCGEFQNRQCGLQGECGATQNSYQVLMTRVGPGGGPNGLPTVAITSRRSRSRRRPTSPRAPTTSARSCTTTAARTPRRRSPSPCSRVRRIPIRTPAATATATATATTTIPARRSSPAAARRPVARAVAPWRSSGSPWLA